MKKEDLRTCRDKISGEEFYFHKWIDVQIVPGTNITKALVEVRNSVPGDGGTYKGTMKEISTSMIQFTDNI